MSNGLWPPGLRNAQPVRQGSDLDPLRFFKALGPTYELNADTKIVLMVGSPIVDVSKEPATSMADTPTNGHIASDPSQSPFSLIGYKELIKKSDNEGKFEALLHLIWPSEPILGVASKLFKRLWDKQANDLKQRKTAIQMTLNQINREVDGLVEHIISTSQPSLISAYERL